MKQILMVLIVSIVFCSNLFAAQHETDKGSMILGGKILFSNFSGDLYEDSNGDALSVTDIEIPFGYFIQQNLAIGGILISNSMSQGSYSSNSFAFGPMISYFFKDNDSKFIPYLAGAIGIMSSSYKYGSYNNSESGSFIYMAAGANYMISKNIALFGEANMQTHNIGDSGSQFTLGGGVRSFIF